jgi:Na+-driven multidrug efflux pump
MRRHWERRRRLLWAAVLLGLVMTVAVLSVIDAGLRIYDHLVSATPHARDYLPWPANIRRTSDLTSV